MSQTENQQPDDERVHDYLVKYGIRFGAGAVVVAGVLAIVLGAHGNLLLWLVLLGPPAVGALVPLLGIRGLSNGINGLGGAFSAGADRVRGRTSKFARYAQQPFFKDASAIWRVSERIPGDHLRAGVRLAAFAYLIALVGFILYVAIYVMLVIIAVFAILLIILFVTGNDEEGKSASSKAGYSGPQERDDDVVAPLRGTYYRGSSWLDEELAGRVDEDGNIYKGASWVSEQKIGRVDAEGNVYKGASWRTEEKVGRIDADGRLYKGSNWFTEERVGRVEKDGTVQEGSNWFTEKKVGRVDKD